MKPIMVFGRRAGEVVHIADTEVIVLEVKDGGKVRLGVRAPHNVPVHRGEIHDLICSEEVVQTVWGRVELPIGA